MLRLREEFFGSFQTFLAISRPRSLSAIQEDERKTFHLSRMSSSTRRQKTSDASLEGIRGRN